MLTFACIFYGDDCVAYAQHQHNTTHTHTHTRVYLYVCRHLGPIDDFAAANLSAMNVLDHDHSCSNPAFLALGNCRNHLQCPSGPGWEKVQLAASGRFAGKDKSVVVDMWRNQGFCMHRASNNFSANAREEALRNNPNLTVGEFYSGLPGGLTPLTELIANITESQPPNSPADWSNESAECDLDNITYVASSKTGDTIDIEYTRLTDGLDRKYVSWDDWNASRSTERATSHQTLAQLQQSSADAAAEAEDEAAGEAAGDSIISLGSTVGDGSGSSVVNVHPVMDIRLYSRFIDPDTGLVVNNEARPCEPIRIGKEVASLSKKGSAKKNLKEQKQCRPQTNMVVLDTVPGAVLVEWDKEKLEPDETSMRVLEKKANSKRQLRRAGWIFLALTILTFYYFRDDDDSGLGTILFVLFIIFVACGYTNKDGNKADVVGPSERNPYAPYICHANPGLQNVGYNFLVKQDKGPIKKKLILQWYLGYETERDWSSECAISRTELELGVNRLQNMDNAEKVASENLCIVPIQNVLEDTDGCVSVVIPNQP